VTALRDRPVTALFGMEAAPRKIIKKRAGSRAQARRWHKLRIAVKMRRRASSCSSHRARRQEGRAQVRPHAEGVAEPSANSTTSPSMPGSPPISPGGKATQKAFAIGCRSGGIAVAAAVTMAEEGMKKAAIF
jgi:hypothetical protein